MGWIVLAALGLAVVGLGLYVVGIYNGLIGLKHAVDRAWANIDVLLKQRHDELPKLVETVKGYMAHERGLLERITEARALMGRAETMAEKSRADAEVRGALERLFAIGFADLDQQAFPQIARANTRWIERLNRREHRLRFFHRVQRNRIAPGHVRGLLDDLVDAVQ